MVNGREDIGHHKKLHIKSSDNLLIVLNTPPKDCFYQCKLTNRPLKYFPDSLHLLLESLPTGRYNLDIQIQSKTSDNQTERLGIFVKNNSTQSSRYLPALSLYILLLFSATLIVISFVNFRNKEKLFDLRNDWTNQLHNDIGGDLSSVSKRLEIMQRKLTAVDQKVFDNLNKTFIILLDIQKKLRFVFNLVDPKKDTLQVMFLGLYDFALDNCSFQGIKFSYKNTIKENQVYKIDVGRINKIYLVLKEALNNAFKSSKAKSITLNIESHKEGISIVLVDDGVGFDTTANYKGNGLKNIRQDAIDGFMDIEIYSEIGVGTRISVLVFAKKAQIKTTSIGGKQAES